MAIKKTVTKLPVGRSVRVESGDVFIIQKDIPMSGFRSIGASLRYPFSEMAAGESFEMKSSKTEIRRAVSRASAACVSYVKKNNKAAKFTVRRTGPDTLRVWRVK
jgi:hypothetical protein